jgi:dihydrofolate synthase/folylpolyglutamate synthase
MTSYSETLDYLYGLIGLGIKPGLRRTRALLTALGNPHLSYPSVIVAGTNGKGSTSASIASILTAAGFQTGLYTSPHLNRFNERIRVSTRDITDREVVETASTVQRAAEGLARGYGRPTFFETATAMAFEHFRRKKIDMAVLEVGMGGRLDSTNVVTPLVSIITSIGMDHTSHLGTNIEEIAREKAGIIKPGSRVITGVEEPGVLRIIKAISTEQGARLHCHGRCRRRTALRRRLFHPRFRRPTGPERGPLAGKA